jgi:uncharacterized DUF497 family protein
MGQFKFALWFAYWYIQSESFLFEWDNGNSVKSVSKHGVPLNEVESVFEFRLAAPIGMQISPPTSEERLCIVGPSFQGRLLSVVFVLREGRVRPVSSRLASRKERKLYEEIRKATKRI